MSVVYHGRAGHFFLRGVSHVLKVWIIADVEDRVRREMKREDISEKEARRILKKDDDERRNWALALYGVDTDDASLYERYRQAPRCDGGVPVILSIGRGTARAPSRVSP